MALPNPWFRRLALGACFAALGKTRSANVWCTPLAGFFNLEVADIVEIMPAVTQAHCQAIGELMAEYIVWDADQTSSLGLDPRVFLDFYYGDEPDELPGEFEPPGGALCHATLVRAVGPRKRHGLVL